MRFLVPGSFRTYSSRNVTCGFALPSLSAGTLSASVHALSRSRQFPHVQFPQCYMRFRSSFSFRRYYSRSGTCDLALPSLSAGTVPAMLHAVSLSLLFPQVLFPQRYMRSRSPCIFRMYIFHRYTCAFSLAPFSAHTTPAAIHMISPSLPAIHFKYLSTITSIFLMFNGLVLVSMLYSKLSPYQ